MNRKIRKGLCVEEMFKLIFETCSNQAKGWEGTPLAGGPGGRRGLEQVGQDLRKY